jgi:hypothetical protein
VEEERQSGILKISQWKREREYNEMKCTKENPTLE